VPADAEATIFDPDRGGLVTLPAEVVDAGTAFVSGAVHPLAASYPFLWSLQLRAKPGLSSVEWPEESGGSAALAKIAARVNADPSLDLPGPGRDVVLHELLGPERERQQRCMVVALERVLELLGRPSG
jgi:hypothetical protein